jgi:hypothetical protein
MTKIFLAGIAALLMATSAHADMTLPPTDPLIGGWCDVKGTTLLKRGSCDFTIEQSGYSGVDDSCTFFEIKRIHNGIEAFSECYNEGTVDNHFRYEKVTFRLIGGKRLKIDTIAARKIKTVETGDADRTVCLRVEPTPDGYLNLRQGPGMNFKVKAKLLPGQRILVDYQTDEWIHMRRVCDSSEQLSGWVFRKYVEKQDLTETPTPSLPPPAIEEKRK